jgi:hypothetical protein
MIKTMMMAPFIMNKMFGLGLFGMDPDGTMVFGLVQNMNITIGIDIIITIITIIITEMVIIGVEGLMGAEAADIMGEGVMVDEAWFSLIDLFLLQSVGVPLFNDSLLSFVSKNTDRSNR